MKKRFHYRYFHYFEKQQCEDYLNAMAKEGYYLRHDCQFEKGSIKEVYYYVDLHHKKQQKDQRLKDDAYIDFLEESGYHFVSYCQPFYIFESSKKHQIHTDHEIEDNITKKTKHFDLIVYIILLFAWLCLMFLEIMTVLLMIYQVHYGFYKCLFN